MLQTPLLLIVSIKPRLPFLIRNVSFVSTGNCFDVYFIITMYLTIYLPFVFKLTSFFKGAACTVYNHNTLLLVKYQLFLNSSQHLTPNFKNKINRRLEESSSSIGYT